MVNRPAREFLRLQVPFCGAGDVIPDWKNSAHKLDSYLQFSEGRYGFAVLLPKCLRFAGMLTAVLAALHQPAGSER
jgi:hypothetical protein